MNSLRTIGDYVIDLIADLRNPDTDYAMVEVHSSLTLKQRFDSIARNYAAFQRMVDAGKADWMRGDPYQIADWASIFTPIESAAWGEIRGDGIALWPQLPVGPFFVDFGNPVTRVALECDGAAYHDPVKDAKRDAHLGRMGWTVYRAPGSVCMKEMQLPSESGLADCDLAEYRGAFLTKTIRGLLQTIVQRHFDSNGWKLESKE